MSGEIIPIYLFVYMLGVFLSAISQVLLKKAAMRPHKNIIEEYLDWRVIVGYAIFVGCTMLSILAYKGIPLSLGPVLEATSYVYVTFFGITIFKEKLNRKKVLGLTLIIIGILIYAIAG